MADMTIFWDLDNTLLDSSRFFAALRTVIMNRGHTEADVNWTLDSLNATGYSFERHLGALGETGERQSEGVAALSKVLADGRPFLFPEVEHVLARLERRGVRQRLLTYGYEPYQEAKWAGLSCLHRYFEVEHFVYQNNDKGDVLAKTTRRGEFVVFVDDSLKWIDIAARKAPWVWGVQARWGEGVETRDGVDGANNLNELLGLLEG